jgi:hypothetical protein
MPDQKSRPIPLPIGPATTLLLESLEALGGIASTHQLAPHLGISLRDTRETLRACTARVRYLGAGYFALVTVEAPPVLDFVERWLRARPRHQGDTAALVQAILDHYPNGDPAAIHRWLQQEPGALQREARGGVIRLLPQRWKHT